MSKTMPVSVRLQPELNDQVAAIALALDRPKSWVIEQAVIDYVAVQNWHLAAIDEGVKAADAGRVVSHEDAHCALQSLSAGSKRLSSGIPMVAPSLY